MKLIARPRFLALTGHNGQRDMDAPKDGHKLSAYVLTKDSDRLLRRVLDPLSRVADEIVVVDSGSSDGTLGIAREFGCRVEAVPFETFSRQRENAQSICTHDHVLSIDSDEVMSEALVQAISELKVAGFDKDAYRIRREWFVLGQPVRAFYPIVSPDYPVRLVDRRVVHFGASNGVHECPAGYVSEELIDAPLSHFTFNSEREFSEKLDFYTSIAANDLLASGKPLRTKPLAAIHALGAFVKWYFMKGSWRDGSIGLRAGRFAASYTWHKYRKAALVRQRP